MENDSLFSRGLGEEQSPSHILQGRCLLHRFPGTAHDLAQTTTSAIQFWLETLTLTRHLGRDFHTKEDEQFGV